MRTDLAAVLGQKFAKPSARDWSAHYDLRGAQGMSDLNEISR